MPTIILVIFALLFMFSSLYMNAIAGAQLAVLAVGLLLIAVILELRQLNNHFTERRKRKTSPQQTKSPIQRKQLR